MGGAPSPTIRAWRISSGRGSARRPRAIPRPWPPPRSRWPPPPRSAPSPAGVPALLFEARAGRGRGAHPAGRGAGPRLGLRRAARARGRVRRRGPGRRRTPGDPRCSPTPWTRSSPSTGDPTSSPTASASRPPGGHGRPPHRRRGPAVGPSVAVLDRAGDPGQRDRPPPAARARPAGRGVRVAARRLLRRLPPRHARAPHRRISTPPVRRCGTRARPGGRRARPTPRRSSTRCGRASPGRRATRRAMAARPFDGGQALRAWPRAITSTGAGGGPSGCARARDFGRAPRRLAASAVVGGRSSRGRRTPDLGGDVLHLARRRRRRSPATSTGRMAWWTLAHRRGRGCSTRAACRRRVGLTAHAVRGPSA